MSSDDLEIRKFEKSCPEIGAEVVESEWDRSDTVLQRWVEKMPWKLQSVLFSGLRGPDHAVLPQIKLLSRWMRSVCQNNADPSKGYMRIDALPTCESLDLELEHSPCHFVHHLADALAVIAYHHPAKDVAHYAALIHYFIAEEIFHFQPESPEVFKLRHRDKRGGTDDAELNRKWMQEHNRAHDAYVDAAMQRFENQ